MITHKNIFLYAIGFIRVTLSFNGTSVSTSVVLGYIVDERTIHQIALSFEVVTDRTFLRIDRLTKVFTTKLFTVAIRT